MKNLSRSAVALAVLATPALANSDSSAPVTEEIMVYGEKQEVSLQDTASSVRVINSAELEKAPIFDITDVFNRTANVAPINEGRKQSNFTIRGVSNYGVASAGSTFTSGGYLDGAPVGNEVIQYAGLGTWDIEQFEILRGPQGTLQGQNSLMGAIISRTKRPTFEESGAFQLQLGNYNTRRTSVAYGNALSDTLAFRVSADRQTSDGAIDNVTRHDNRAAYSDRSDYRAKLLWQPVYEFDMMLTLASVRADDGADNNVRDDKDGRFEAVADLAQRSRYRSDIAILESNWALDDRLTLTMINSISNGDYDIVQDYDYSASPGNIYDYGYNGEVTSHELRIAWESDTVSALGGVYFTRNHRDSGYAITSPYPTSVFRNQILGAYTSPPFNLDDATAEALYGFLPDAINANYGSGTNEYVSNRALFGQLTWNINYDWSVTAGLRYDSEKLNRTDAADARILNEPSTNPTPVPGVGTVGDVINMTLQQLANQLTTAPERVESEYNVLLPKLQTTWHTTEDLSFSLLTQKGYRAGGARKNESTGEIVQYDPEYTWNYELAVRSQWFDRRLTINSNLYYIDWEDQQVYVSNSGDRFDRQIENAGKSSISGIELEADGQVSDSLRLFASYGLASTRFEEFTSTDSSGNTTSYKGKQFRQAPRHTVAGGIEYNRDRFSVLLDGNYISSRYTDNENRESLSGRSLFNVRGSFQADEHLELSAWVTNLLDREYDTGGFDRNTAVSGPQDVRYMGDPRMAGVGIRYDF